MLRRNILSVSVAIVILATSLTGAGSFSKLSFASFPGADKLVHFIIYFVFMAVVIFEHRNNIKTIGRLMLYSIFPFVFGSLMELLQAWVTSTRSGSWKDILANFAGIIAAVLISLLIKRFRSAIIK